MEKLELKSGNLLIMDKIENDLQRIYNHYRSVVNRNDYLSKENERLKSEAYKNEELSEMKKRYDEMKADYYRGFPISEEEDNKIKKWITNMMEKHPANSGAIGGRFRYEFICTSIGSVGTVIDSFTGEKFTFRDLYEA